MKKIFVVLILVLFVFSIGGCTDDDSMEGSNIDDKGKSC
jgi:hypothetical protein